MELHVKLRNQAAQDFIQKEARGGTERRNRSSFQKHFVVSQTKRRPNSDHHKNAEKMKTRFFH